MQKKRHFNGSINSKLTTHENFIIKSFNRDDEREKFKRELNFYKHCHALHINSVPALYGYNEDECWIKIEYLIGIEIHKFSNFYLKALVKFIKSINLKIAENKIKASESILKYTDLLEHISVRVNSLDSASKSHLPKGFHKHLKDISKTILSKTSEDLPYLLSPSDIGIHNSIFSNETHSFFDFEYSGIDSPIKLAYDTVLHPANKIGANLHSSIINKLFFNLGYRNFLFDYDVYRAFVAWWILRLVNSINEKVICSRLQKQTLSASEIDSYVSQRLATAAKFWRLLDI